jgi:hypothetical protein
MYVFGWHTAHPKNSHIWSVAFHMQSCVPCNCLQEREVCLYMKGELKGLIVIHQVTTLTDCLPSVFLVPCLDCFLPSVLVLIIQEAFKS